jgi:hypothetical protein
LTDEFRGSIISIPVPFECHVVESAFRDFGLSFFIVTFNKILESFFKVFRALGGSFWEMEKKKGEDMGKGKSF